MSRSLIDAIYILSLTNIVHYTKFSPKRQQGPNHRCCRSRMFLKIGALKDKHLCWSLFLIKLQFFKKETPVQVFSCKYCKIFRNSFFYRTPPVAAPWKLNHGLLDWNHVCLFFLRKLRYEPLGLNFVILLQKPYRIGLGINLLDINIDDQLKFIEHIFQYCVLNGNAAKCSW